MTSVTVPVWAQSRKTQKIGLEDGKTVKAQIISRRLNTDRDLTFDDVVIEKSEITELKKKYGEVKTIRTGEEGNRTSSICYTNGKEDVIRFSSNETGRGKIVTAIEAYKSDVDDATNCVESENFPKTFKNKRDIRLGISKDSVTTILGKRSYSIGKNNFGYTYSTVFTAPKEMDCSEKAIGISTYQFRFRKNKVVYFKVAQVTSCWTPVATTDI